MSAYPIEFELVNQNDEPVVISNLFLELLFIESNQK